MAIGGYRYMSINNDKITEGLFSFFKTKTINTDFYSGNDLIILNEKIKKYNNDGWGNELKDRRIFLKNALNVLSEAKRKFSDYTWFDFETPIDILRAFILKKDYIDVSSLGGSANEYYEDFAFMNQPIPNLWPNRLSGNEYYDEYNFHITAFESSIYDYAEDCQYAKEFSENKRSVRNSEDTKEYYESLNKVIDYLQYRFSKSIYFWNIKYAGDWDGGGTRIYLKPSQEIQNIVVKDTKLKRY